MKNKKGELTSKQLITIIILIVSFTIIVAFFVMLGLKSIISDESCRNSVMMKSIPFGDWVFVLKCKTEDICFSMGGECGVKTDKTIEVENKDELIKETVNLLAECWWRMGEGKVKYGGNGDCAICYKVYFDEEAKKINPNWINIASYISTAKMPNRDITYGGYLYSGEETKLIEGETILFTDIEYAVVTGIYDGKYIPPYFIKFSASELRSKLGCSSYVTEV